MSLIISEFYHAIKISWNCSSLTETLVDMNPKLNLTLEITSQMLFCMTLHIFVTYFEKGIFVLYAYIFTVVITFVYSSVVVTSDAAGLTSC